MEKKTLEFPLLTNNSQVVLDQITAKMDELEELFKWIGDQDLAIAKEAAEILDGRAHAIRYFAKERLDKHEKQIARQKHLDNAHKVRDRTKNEAPELFAMIEIAANQRIEKMKIHESPRFAIPSFDTAIDEIFYRRFAFVEDPKLVCSGFDTERVQRYGADVICGYEAKTSEELWRHRIVNEHGFTAEERIRAIDAREVVKLGGNGKWHTTKKCPGVRKAEYTPWNKRDFIWSEGKPWRIHPSPHHGYGPSPNRKFEAVDFHEDLCKWCRTNALLKPPKT